MALANLGIPLDVVPYRLSGAVYGTLVNHRSALEQLGGAVHEAPYKGAPRAPVLYLKPRNTLQGDGAVVSIPQHTDELEVGACLGLVIRHTACRVDIRSALSYVAGYVIVNDLCIPHSDFYRPSVRLRACDGFCPMGPRMTPVGQGIDADTLRVRVHVDGVQVQDATTADHVRGVARLLAEVTQFMTLAAGDVLATGSAVPAPRVRAGQQSIIEIEGLGRLFTRYVAEAT